MVVGRPIPRLRPPLLRVRGGAFVLAELRETGVLTASAIPSVTSLLALVLLLVSRGQPASRGTWGVGSSAAVASCFAGLLCATQLLHGGAAGSAVGLGVCFAVGATLSWAWGSQLGKDSEDARPTGQLTSQRRTMLIPSLAGTFALSLVLPVALTLMAQQSHAQRLDPMETLTLGERALSASHPAALGSRENLNKFVEIREPFLPLLTLHTA